MSRKKFAFRNSLLRVHYRANSMWLLLLAAVGVPVMALSFFTLLEAALTTNTVWVILQKVGTDLCNLSIGIVGGMFLNTALQNKLGVAGAPIIGIALVMVNLILAAVVILLNRRFPTTSLNTKAYLSIFLGLISVILPSVMIVYFGVK